MKTCTKCSVSKPESDFHVRSDTGKPRNECKICYRKVKREYYENNREQLLATVREYAEINREQVLAGKREHYKNNRESELAKRREHQAKSRKAINKTRKRRYHYDFLHKLTRRLRGRITDALAGKSKKSAKTVELLGAPWVWVEACLEEQFLPGMTWENHGPVWHIDHIRPCASFDLTDPEQQRMCFHWTNLQPLFAQDNLRKSDKYDPQTS